MGVVKNWSWHKRDWDERIRCNQVEFGDDIGQMNSTELVEILNLRGVRAHRGLKREELVQLLQRSLAGDEIPEIAGPLDFLRRRLIWFVARYHNKISGQLDEHCDGKCGDKADSEVLLCYTSSRDLIEEEIKKHGYKD